MSSFIAPWPKGGQLPAQISGPDFTQTSIQGHLQIPGSIQSHILPQHNDFMLTEPCGKISPAVTRTRADCPVEGRGYDCEIQTCMDCVKRPVSKNEQRCVLGIRRARALQR